VFINDWQFLYPTISRPTDQRKIEEIHFSVFDSIYVDSIVAQPQIHFPVFEYSPQLAQGVPPGRENYGESME
jgi:hypothetical protein